MSGVQLPKPLEITLDTLLTDNKLSSWQVKGGEHFIQVSIRFSTTAIESNICDVKYRRAPPSRIIRDNIRAKDYHATDDLRECVGTDMIPIIKDTQHPNIEEKTNNVTMSDQGSSTALPLLVASIDIPSSAASHVQSLEIHTEDDGSTGNIDTDQNNIDSDNSLGDSAKSEESNDYENKCLQTILDYMERKE